MQKFIAVIVALSFLIGSAMPGTPHIPKVLETIEEHLEMAAEHGHSHGFVEDLFWAMHGHSHDVADHDHSPLYIVFADVNHRDAGADSWGAFVPRTKVSPYYKIMRPPKV